jgi:hypothetical protein
MLVHAHAAGDAVHDDAEPLLRHSTFLFGLIPDALLGSRPHDG